MPYMPDGGTNYTDFDADDMGAASASTTVMIVATNTATGICGVDGCLPSFLRLSRLSCSGMLSILIPARFVLRPMPDAWLFVDDEHEDCSLCTGLDGWLGLGDRKVTARPFARLMVDTGKLRATLASGRALNRLRALYRESPPAAICEAPRGPVGSRCTAAHKGAQSWAGQPVTSE